MDDKIIWTFPEDIQLEEVSEYLNRFKTVDASKEIVFDLKKTLNIHSSFVGFMIHAKNAILKKGGSLKLELSFTTERILTMLNIIDFFKPEDKSIITKKSA